MMAAAYQCDRCGRFYAEDDRDIKLQKGSNSYISNLWIGNRNWDSGRKDLCPDCARDFLCWWEHSNISARYMLDKMAAETARKMIENDRQIKIVPLT